jgi:hypothetical protein
MSCVEITNVQVFNNPAKFVDPFQFEITFECIHPLEDGKNIPDPSLVGKFEFNELKFEISNRS